MAGCLFRRERDGRPVVADADNDADDAAADAASDMLWEGRLMAWVQSAGVEEVEVRDKLKAECSG